MKPYLCLWLGLCLLFAPFESLLAQRRATILDHQDRIRLTPLDVVNSRYRETNLSITPDGEYLYFMSLRGGQPWSQKFMMYKADSVYDGDIWYSRKEGGRWQPPRCMPYGINTSDGEDEPNVSPDGSTVYFQSWNPAWMIDGGPYYRVQRRGSRWGEKVGMGTGITEFFRYFNATDGMSISPNGRLFVVAAGRDYNGNMDLYLSRRSSRGWTVCKRMPISTPNNERSVFIAADNKTIYFASDGYHGFGGLDIYKATLQADGSMGEVINIGAPFNTPGDDYGFILTADGQEAYFVRNGDIYFADLKEADERIRPGLVKTDHHLAGTIRDSASFVGVRAEVVLLDARTKRLVAKVMTSSSGRYEIELPNQDKIYDQVVYADGYETDRRRITVREKPTGERFTANFVLSPTAPPRVAVADPPARPTPPPAPTPEPKSEVRSEPEETEEPRPKVVEVVPPAPKEKPAETEAKLKPAPPVAAPPEPENPYSFEGVAENNLTLLLDVSASMQESGKLPLLKDALGRMLTHMRPEDRISIIAYSGDAKVVVDGVSAAQRQEILTAIDQLHSAGSTDSRSAMRKALHLARGHYISGGNNRVILATDGSFDIEDLYNLSERMSGYGIVLSVFSFGKLPAYKTDQLLELAQRGRGVYAQITSENADAALLQEARAVRK